MIDQERVESLVDNNKADELIEYLSADQATAKPFYWEKDFYVFTPLSYACERNRSEIIAALIDKGLYTVSVDVPGTRAMILDPVYALVGNENMDSVKLLLQAGLSPDIALENLENMGGEAILKGKILKIFKFLEASK